MDSDPGGPKTCGSGGSGTLLVSIPDAELHILAVYKPVSEPVVLLGPLGPGGVGEGRGEPVRLRLQDLGLEGAAAHAVGADQHQGLALEGGQLYHLLVQTQFGPKEQEHTSSFFDKIYTQKYK
jgi:hypothetical protein